MFSASATLPSCSATASVACTGTRAEMDAPSGPLRANSRWVQADSEVVGLVRCWTDHHSH